MGVFGATVSDLGDFLEPRRLAAALVLTGGWIVWLFVAELVGAGVGVVVATAILAGVLAGQLRLEHRALGPSASRRSPYAPVVPALLLAVGASALLAAAWFIDWGIVSPPLELGVTTVVIRVEALQIGALVFGLFGFLAHQRRLQRVLDP
jgi:hypothetical protein